MENTGLSLSKYACRAGSNIICTCGPWCVPKLQLPVIYHRKFPNIAATGQVNPSHPRTGVNHRSSGLFVAGGTSSSLPFPSSHTHAADFLPCSQGVCKFAAGFPRPNSVSSCKWQQLHNFSVECNIVNKYRLTVGLTFCPLHDGWRT